MLNFNLTRNIIIALILLIFINARASYSDSLFIFSQGNCDACGCSINNVSNNFEGLLSKQFIGLKYFSQHYKTRENVFITEPKQDEFYNSLQLWGKVPISKKLVLYATIPYQFNYKDTNPKTSIKGLGDVSVLANYFIFNDRDNSKNSPHKISVNAGVKIPTGKFDENNTTSTNPSFQLGTGSWDILTSANYQFIKEKFAVFLGTDYIIKTQNPKEYKFGNQWNNTLMLYYFTSVKGLKITPKVGAISELFQDNEQRGYTVPNTSGNMILGKTGVEVSYKKFTLGSDVSIPFHTNLMNDEVKPISRFSLFINFNF